MDAPDTVTEALRSLRNEGYEVEFQLIDGVLRAAECGSICRVDEAVVERLFRFEGPSDPGDEMAVFGLRDPASGTRGVLATGFGPAADPQVLNHLIGLSSRFDGP